MWTPTTLVSVVRDLVLLGVGSFGILFQQFSGVISVPLLVLYTAMVGVPGVARVMQMVARTAAIEQPSSPPPEPSQPGAPGP